MALQELNNPRALQSHLLQGEPAVPTAWRRHSLLSLARLYHTRIFLIQILKHRCS